MDERKFLFAYDRRRTSTLTLDEQPGAHAGATRQYIPGYSSSNIVYLNTASGNDSNDGSTELLAKLTYASAATAAGSTKKIQGINDGLALSTNITKPTEMKRGVSGTISGSLTTPVDAWTQAGTPSFGTSIVYGSCWSPKLKIFVACGESGKIATSPDGNVFTQKTSGFSSSTIFSVCWAENINLFVAVGDSGKISTSPDGETWTAQTPVDSSALGCVRYFKELGIFVAVGSASQVIVSSDGEEWHKATGINSDMIAAYDIYHTVEYLPETGRLVLGSESGGVYYSSDGEVWTTGTNAGAYAVYDSQYVEAQSAVYAVAANGRLLKTVDGITWTSLSSAVVSGVSLLYVQEIAVWIIPSNLGIPQYSTNQTSWTDAATPSFGGSGIHSGAYSPLLGKAILTGASGKIAYSTAFANTISANVAGFTIQAVQYSGTITAYNCTMKQPGTTANLSLNACRITEAGSHISSNTAGSFATLFEGDRHTTCTPAAQNDIDMNLDTVGGTWYIYNASQTGYERIRDCIVEGGIVANYPVTVSGRANTRGTSENVLFGATVTHNDPKFVDTTDYALQFQTNGYDKNSPAAGRSAIYFNSSGGARDIGAWSYIESAVSYYYAKSRYLYKGQDISHGLEFNLTEQQGDSGVMNVYGNTQRIKEVLTMQYGSTQEEERAVFYEMLTLKDKGVKITFAEWEDNTGTVTVNGNQSAGAEFLTVDAVQVFNGMTVTIAGKVYSVMRASPNMTAATKLILDRPTTDAVSDNDVLTTNYPSGQGEYQFSGPTNITMKQNAATGLTGWRTGFAIRLIRKYQG
jgi:hypothetical protein